MGTDGSTQTLTVKVTDAPNGDMLLDISYVVHLATANESFNYDVYMAVNDLGISPSMPILGVLSGTDVPGGQLLADLNLVSWLTPIDPLAIAFAAFAAAADPACKKDLQDWMTTWAAADAANTGGMGTTLLGAGIGAFGGPVTMIGGACLGLWNWESRLTPALKALKVARDNYKKCCMDNPMSPCCPVGQTAKGPMPQGC
jgi:hypothetical protein